MLGIGAHRQRMVAADRALPGRSMPMPLPDRHHVHGRPLRDDSGALADIRFGMGCFWGAERLFWSLPGVYTTVVGYAGGFTPNATYDEVCSGETGHAEVVRVLYDPARLGIAQLLSMFWEAHDPTQGMRQGNDVGSQYRSAIHCTAQAQYDAAIASRAAYQRALDAAGRGSITTEIVFPAPAFYAAEEYHQQYLSKNPAGYCGLRGTGVACATG